jgi:hypothetical protein
MFVLVLEAAQAEKAPPPALRGAGLGSSSQSRLFHTPKYWVTVPIFVRP